MTQKWKSNGNGMKALGLTPTEVFALPRAPLIGVGDGNDNFTYIVFFLFLVTLIHTCSAYTPSCLSCSLLAFPACPVCLRTPDSKKRTVVTLAPATTRATKLHLLHQSCFELWPIGEIGPRALGATSISQFNSRVLECVVLAVVSADCCGWRRALQVCCVREPHSTSDCSADVDGVVGQ
jgi:hypothetical protein